MSNETFEGIKRLKDTRQFGEDDTYEAYHRSMVGELSEEYQIDPDIAERVIDRLTS